MLPEATLHIAGKAGHLVNIEGGCARWQAGPISEQVTGMTAG